MQVSGTTFAGVAVLGALAIIGSMMNPHQTSAQGPGTPLNVNVASPIPLPVTIRGTPTISGAVSISNVPLPAQLNATTTVLWDVTNSFPAIQVGPLDISAFKTIRVIVDPLACAAPCGSAEVYSNDIKIDSFGFATGSPASRVYEMPGTKFKLWVDGTAGGAHVVVFGRSN